MTFLEAFIIAVVEGLTEFLPVSSTGHMVITQALLGMDSDEFVKLFTVNIQFGAILSVLLLYWKRFLQDIPFYIKLIIAFIPAGIIGLLAGDQIDLMLESPLVVGITLLIGGVVLLYVDNWFKTEDSTTQITNQSALYIGLFQCIALIPGVSRSAATIIGGMTQGLSRKTAAEFSFFLAVPTMAAASGYKLLKVFLKGDPTVITDNLSILLFGNVVAFIVALLAIRFFIGFLTKHGFRLFGWYRIVVGAIILILLAAGVNLSVV
ncbi:MAG TPA: undecaprenyl-diphosphate phosphatase [Flavobacteriales bacterium]|nr:undecaprenyl-diphosphate phosphatase [Flavobacteriales bacterium]HPH81928.1 undecaprenyl-diphosphate phosphatase [Flavobacteriales bacterium]